MIVKHELDALRTDIGLASCTFVGPGAAVLRAALRNTRFVVMGEDHGIAETAEVASVLYEMLQSFGHFALAVEIGRYAAAELARILGSASPRAQMRAYLDSYPFSLAFYDWTEEFGFLERAASLSGSRFCLMGIDQELMGASKLLLHKALEQSRDPAIRTSIEVLLAREAEHFQRALGSGNPEDLFMVAADPEPVRALGQALRRMDADRAAPVEALLESRAIYTEMHASSYLANVRRARLMKQEFATVLRSPTDKVMVKIGSYHGFKVPGPLKTREIGALVAELADAGGSRSLHVLVLGVRGEQLAFAGIGRPAAREAFDLRDPDSLLPGARPLAEIAAEHTSWSLFDLRPLRPMLLDLTPVEPAIEQVILGYDLAIMIPEASASTVLP
jgi:hypothetical protein